MRKLLLLAALAACYDEPDYACYYGDGYVECYDYANPYYRQEYLGMAIYITVPNGEELRLDDEELSAEDSEGNFYWVDGIAFDLVTGAQLAGEEFNVHRMDGSTDVVQVSVRITGEE